MDGFILLICELNEVLDRVVVEVVERKSSESRSGLGQRLSTYKISEIEHSCNFVYFFSDELFIL